MIKLIVASILAVLCVSSAMANGDMPKDSDGTKAPIFSPDGRYVTLLTVNSTTTDLTSKFMYSVIGTAATCKLRLMPTSAKGAYVSFPVPAAAWLTFAVNKNTPFVNLSGCTGGYLVQH